MDSSTAAAPKAAAEPGARRRGRAAESAGKDEIIDFVSRDLDTSKRDARLIVESVVKGITELSRTHATVRVPSLGNFRVLDTAPREGRNPRTGEAVPIDAGRRVTFRAAKSFKDGLVGKVT
jgi:DNA-binding protein HU-beta